MRELSASDAALLTRIRERLHSALIVLLIALRPLVWDGDAASVANLAYLVMVLIAVMVVLAESWCGAVTRWRWSTTGLVFAGVVVVAVPAMWRSPLPMEGWTLELMLVMHLGLAFYLMQAVPGRERLAVAALGAGLAGEAMIALGQRWWVLPGMSAAQAHGDFNSIETPTGDLAERIRNGGIYGTFTLANTLAAYLILVVPPLAAAAFARGAPPLARWLAALLVGASAVSFVGASSKGAVLAMAVAGGIAWMVLLRRPWRWIPLALVAAGVIAVVVMPSALEPLRASTRVRLGYWEGAAALIVEKPLIGHGIGGFTARSPAAIPLWADGSRRVHNEVLEAAVDGGVVLAAVLAALLARLAWLRRPLSSEVESAIAAPHVGGGWAGVFLAAGVVYFSILGMLESNLAWWPAPGSALWGAGSTAMHVDALAWAAVIGAAMAAVLVVLQRLPAPPPWSFALGFLALAVHSLLDFDLHSAAIWGTAIACACACACAAPRPDRAWAIARTGRGLIPLMLMTMATAGMAALLIGSCLVALRLREAHDLADHMKDAFAAVGDARTHAFERLAAQTGIDVTAEDLQRVEERRLVFAAARDRVLELAWPDRELELSVTASQSAGAQREPRTRRIAALMPHSSFAHTCLAEDHAALADAALAAGSSAEAAAHWLIALDAQRRSIALFPAHLPTRRRLCAFLDRAQTVLIPQAPDLKREADDQRAEIERLATIVSAQNK